MIYVHGEEKSYLYIYTYTLIYIHTQSFRMLNDVFSAFDDEVRRFKLFKYHHVFNTYIVASPSAALWHTAHKGLADEHTAMLALAVRLKLIASTFLDNSGLPLTVAIGMDRGPMVGKIVGSERSFWCLFGSPINTAARLASLSWKTRECDFTIAVVSADASRSFEQVRARIREGKTRGSQVKAKERKARQVDISSKSDLLGF